MSVGNGGQGCVQVGVRVDGVQLTGFNERGHACPSVAALIMSCEQSVLAIEGDGPDGIFDRVGVHLDAAIGQEDLQALPVPVDVCKLLAEAGFGGETAALMGQPLAEAGNQRCRLVSSDSKAFVGGLASDLGLDLVDFRDATQAFGGDFGAVFLVDVMQLAPCVRPAIGQGQRRAAHPPRFSQGVISSISIDLQDALEASQNVHRMPWRPGA